MGYKEHVSSPDMSLRFYVKIQGLPYIWLSGEVPIAQDGTPWLSGSYALVSNSFDASDVQDIGCNLSRISGGASPASMLIRLIEDRAYTNGGIFAWDKQTGALANLADDFPYETGSGPWTMTVDSTADFASSGTLYLGRETMTYTSKTATTFNVTSRTLYDPVGYGDTVYRHNSNLPSAPRVVADHARNFIGRYVQVHAHWVTADGYAVDDAFDGDASFECFRGFIRELPRAGSDWSSIEFEIEAIDSLLRTTVGAELKQGNLSLEPLAKWAAGSSDTEIQQGKFFLVGGSSRKFHVIVRDTAGAVVLNASGPNAIDILTGTGTPDVPPVTEVLTEEQLFGAFFLNVNQVIQATVSNLEIRLDRIFSGGGYEYSGLHTSTNYSIEINHDGQDSVCSMLGFKGTSTSVTNGSFLIFASVAAQDASASYVSATATSIPFTYVNDADLMTAMAPIEPGFAVIGDGEEAEIVSYQSISSIATDVASGLYQMNGVQRGLMGTTAKVHKTSFQDDQGSEGGADVRFGVGVLNDSFLLTILNLAQSTGDGNHGGYDLFGVGVGTPQAPGHFDSASFLEASSDMTPTEQTVSYFLSKPEQLSKLCRDWLNPVGRFMFPRVDSQGQYTIGVGRQKPAIASQSVLSLDTTQMHWSDPATYQRGTSNIVTGVTVYPVWDFANEESKDSVKVSVINTDAEAEYGHRNVIEWNLRGYTIGPGQALDLTKNWASQLAQRHGRGKVVLRLTADRRAWWANIGDTIELTVPEIPTPDGGRGLVTRYGVVENIVKIYSGDEPGAILTVVVESSALTDAFMPYAPSAKVVSKSGSDIVLAANEYTESGSDVDYFSVGDRVVIHNEGDYSTREARTIDAISGNTVTLSSAVSLTVGSWTAMDFDDYASAITSQRDGAAFISDSAHQLSTGDDGMRYT
jgi:hypothetical protein